MSILNKIANLNKIVETETRQEMTDLQVQQCKEALRRDNRGFNVQPNRFDLNKPYRVAVNYQNKWHNFGNFKSADVAAAIGAIVSAAFFGEKAQVGDFDPAKVEGADEYEEWLKDSRNQDVIARAEGNKPCVHEDGGVLEEPMTTTGDVNPF